MEWSQCYGDPFLKDIVSSFNDTRKYEDKSLKLKALQAIPIEELQHKAIIRMRKHQMLIKADETQEPDMSLEHAVLLELLSWFKKSFFKWMNEPKCKSCGKDTKHARNSTENVAGQDIRVEVFVCKTCNAETNFYRYKDPGILLSTRTGRCGEWANCFALLCHSLNYDTRFVLDSTDHAWVEVYSYPEKRWLHCDPCENVCDSPLLYEVGWGKKLEYVMAFSKDEVQDVTWRYTTNHKEVLKRRNKCPEENLVNLIVSLNSSKWQKLSESRIKFLQKRAVRELVDLMVEKDPKATDKVGRTSGSLSWRLQRKELNPWAPFTWSYSQYKQVCIKYSTDKDSYKAVTPENNQVIDCKAGWMEGAYLIENIFRKEEEDWKMVYLAREEKKENGKITWRFCTNGKVTMEDITIKVLSKCYENGSVDWTVCYNNECRKIPKEQGKYNGSVDWTVCYNNECRKIPKEQESMFIIQNMKSVNELTLTAHLSGGKGDVAWQHAQIFRQQLDSDVCPMEITIKYNLINDGSP